MSLRDALVAGAAALAATAMLALPVSQRLEGLSVDVLHWLEQEILGPRHTPESSPVVVIAIDETTYRTPLFRDVPKVMWTREIASILDAVREAGADIVGFDVIFPTSLQKHIPGVDRDFLVALRDAARQGKVVLGKVQHSDKPIAPFAAQSFAVGHSKNIRILNLHEDPDGIIRRVPLFFDVEAKDGSLRREPSMALELAARSLGAAPETGAKVSCSLPVARFRAPPATHWPCTSMPCRPRYQRIPSPTFTLARSRGMATTFYGSSPAKPCCSASSWISRTVSSHPCDW